MRDTTYVAELPACDTHLSMGEVVPAAHDAKTIYGPWAYLCDDCLREFGYAQPGTGFAHRLIVGERPVPTRAEKARALREAIEAGDFDEAEDIIGDGDIAEFL